MKISLKKIQREIILLFKKIPNSLILEGSSMHFFTSKGIMSELG